MRISLLPLAAALVFLSSSIPAQEIRIMETGTFHGEEAQVKEGELWLGLYKQGNEYRLMPSILSIKTKYDPIVDSVGESTGAKVSVPGMGEPLFLVSGGGFERSQLIEAVEIGKTEITSGFDEGFTFGKADYRLHVVTNPGDQTAKKDSFVKNNSQLVFSNGEIEQTLYQVTNCSFCRWQVKWIGDLDSDGKPDLYLMLTDHYNVSNQKLFLSSRAEIDGLLKEVAEFTTTGC
jgi:hypothetical protein